MKGYQQIRQDERIRISHMREEGATAAAIAARLGRHRGTICRELRRNGNADGSYLASSARQRVRGRQRGRPPSKLRPPSLNEPQGSPAWQFVQAKLVDEHYSPELIAGRLALVLPDQTVCMESVYRFIYHPAQRKEKLWQHLHCQRAARRPRGSRAAIRAKAKRGPSIALRSQEANERSAAGHWEADLLCFAKQTGAVMQVVERKYRFRFAIKLDSKHSKPLATKLVAAFDTFPSILRETLTMDNGSEFADWAQLKQELGMDCYFCDPYAAWQKGTLEALNGILRRYLPRSTDLKTLDQEELTDICEELNDRPMKVLGFHTPREMLHSDLGLSVALHLRT